MKIKKILILNLISLSFIAFGMDLRQDPMAAEGAGAGSCVQNELINAAKLGNVDLVKHLLEANKDPNETYDNIAGEGSYAEDAVNNYTPLMAVLSSKGIDDGIINQIINALAEKGANPNISRGDYETALIVAAKFRSPAVISNFLAKFPDTDINYLENWHEGETALTAAIKENPYNKLEVVTTLLKNKANAKLANNMRETPLMLAASNGTIPMLQALIENGADVNFDDYDFKRRNVSDHAMQNPNNSDDIIDFLENDDEEEPKRLSGNKRSAGTGAKNGGDKTRFKK